MIESLKEHNSEVMAIKILKGRPYTCPTLRPPKGKRVAKLENKEEYMFDIFKTNQIFDHLLKD